MSGIFNVYFDGQYWVGLVLEESENHRRVGRFIFGDEPSPNQIFEWAKKGCPGLILTEVLPGEDQDQPSRVNPKRLQREARRALENKGLGSFAQDQIRKAIEKNKKTSQTKSREKRLIEERARFDKLQLKKKKKKRGH